MAPGTVVIRPLAGCFYREIEQVPMQDLYCVVTIGSQRQQTRPAVGCGKDPNWSDQLTFLIQSEDIAHFEIWGQGGRGGGGRRGYNDSYGGDEYICEGSFSIAILLANAMYDIPCRYKGRNAGTLKVDITYVSMGGSLPSPGLQAGIMGVQPGIHQSMMLQQPMQQQIFQAPPQLQMPTAGGMMRPNAYQQPQFMPQQQMMPPSPQDAYGRQNSLFDRQPPSPYGQQQIAGNPLMGGVGPGAYGGYNPPPPPQVRRWVAPVRIDKNLLIKYADEIFQQCDENGNGVLEHFEFYPAFCSLCRRIGIPPPMPADITYIFDSFNVNQDSGLSWTEFKNLCDDLFGMQGSGGFL